MTRTSTNLFAAAVALMLTVVTFQQTIAVPSAPSPVAAVQLA